MVNQSQFIEMFGTPDNHPTEYAVKNLGDLSECYAGATPSTKVKEYWDNGTIPWMSSGEVHMGHVTETESKITESGYKHASTKMVPVHSVVIALAGQGKTRGTVAITEIPLCTNQSLCAIVPSKDIHYEYLYHNLKGRYLELRGMAGDVNGRGGLNLKIVQSIKVIVPPLSEQMRFVDIAQQADKSKFAGFKSQFIEMFGLPSANHKAFTVGSIADVVSDVHYGTSRQSNEDGDYPYLRMNNITYEGDLDLSDLKMISVPKEELSGCLVKKGDVLFNRTNSKDLVGKTCCFSLEQPMIIAGYIIRLRMNGLVLPEYLSVFLNLPGSKIMLQDISKGAVGQANINAKEVQSISLLIPPIELQNQFVAQKNQADKSKFELKKAIEKIDKVMRALMQ